MTQIIDGSVIRDELRNVVSMLCTRFPECSQVEVEWVVAEVYERLAANARIPAHLIPLTLNHARRLLSEHRRAVPKGLDGNDFRPQIAAHSRPIVSKGGCAS